MQLLNVPHTNRDMTYSLSLSGVTVLTLSKYKQRHGGSRDIVQDVAKGFMHLKAYRKSQSTPKSVRKKKLNTGPPDHNKPAISPKMRQYHIDKKQVTHRIRGYVNQMHGEKMLYFWTVSFPINTSDSIAYILLNKWLTRLRQERLLQDYLWVAERQQNKTIHFHMVINKRLDVQKANRYMRASIMHCINKSEIDWSREAAMKYNGVDIAKDRKTRRVINFAKCKKQKALTNYLTKYITKNDGVFTRLAWHSSRGYSNIITSIRFTMDEFIASNTPHLVDKESPIITNYFTFYRWKGSPPPDLLLYLSFANQKARHAIESYEAMPKK